MAPASSMFKRSGVMVTLVASRATPARSGASAVFVRERNTRAVETTRYSLRRQEFQSVAFRCSYLSRRLSWLVSSWRALLTTNSPMA